ncbi:histidinol dehydrogenase, partial [Clostridium perfringens]
MKVVSARDFQLKRENDYGTPEQNEVVKAIVRDVRSEGDAALLRHTEQLDRVRLTADQLRVTDEELKEAYHHVESSFV